MTADLTGLRGQLKTALVAADFFAFSTLPEKAPPPLVYVAAGDPYVTPVGATFGGLVVNHQLVLVASAGVNEARADELDEMIAGVIDVIEGLGEFGYEVGRPGSITIEGQDYLGVAIELQTETRRS